jgi:urease accessory protein
MRVAHGPVEAEGTADAGRIVVDETQRRRSRFRTRTDDGETVGVVVDGAGVLSAGDVLETEDGERLVVELEATEALVVEFDGANDPAAMVVAGHAVGNRHWDLVAHEGRVYVPTDGDREGRTAFLEPYLPQDANVRVESVDPSLFDERRTAHGHGDGDGDGDGGHGHGHGHEHEHSHGHEHEHGEHGHDHTNEAATLTRDRLRRRGETDE